MFYFILKCYEINNIYKQDRETHMGETRGVINYYYKESGCIAGAAW